MKRIRKTQSVLNLPTVTLEGGLILPDQLEKAAQGRADGQTETDYGTPKGIKLKDEYSRAFQIACAQWQQFAAQLERNDVDPDQLTVSFVQELLRDAFDYTSLQPVHMVTVGQLRYPVSFLSGSLPVLAAPHTLGLDEADPRFVVFGGGSRKKTPFQALQELLNASSHHLWGIACNGRVLRLLRDTASLTRPSFLEVDLADLLGGQRYAEFASVWRLLHASRAPQPGKPDNACYWERWREAGQEEGSRVREGLREGVTQALLTLGEGFLQHPDNKVLCTDLEKGVLTKDNYFQQLLRLIYRLIFVFTVEERGVLHPRDDSQEAQAAQHAYAEGYTLARLRNLCLKRRLRTRHDDLWQAIRIVFRGLAKGEPLLALPALGGLFSPDQCPDLDSASLDNAHLFEALKQLRWAATGPGRSLVPVDYRNMGPEELGSVYESLLELIPSIDPTARSFDFVGLTEEGSTAGNARKLSGSYYTPDSLVQELIKSALDPVIEQRLASNRANPTQALLNIRVVDPACGSGHFLLAAARRLAEHLAQLRSIEGGQEGAVKPQDYRHALREVVASSIYGVDRNPLAIELARTALWLEGFEENRPLTFLDHHLQVGDALLGLIDLKTIQKGIARDAFKVLSGDDKETVKQLAKDNAAGLKLIARDLQGKQLVLGMDNQSGLQALRAIEAMPAETPDQVAAKETAYRSFLEESAQSPLAMAADVAVGAYLLTKTPDTAATIPTSGTLHALLTAPQRTAEPNSPRAHEVRTAQNACREVGVFHWPLAFPQVFAQGGFDCVLGNPPWERIKLQEEEFFAIRHRDIANARNKAERAQRIQWLSEGMLARHLYPELAHESYEDKTEKRLYREFVIARRVAEASSVFVHVDGAEGGRYPLTGVGDVNTYALFAETILQINIASGRSGFIVPTGIATDDTTKAYFGGLAQSARLVSLYGFWEIRRIFPGTDSRDSFCIITLGSSGKAEFLFHAKSVDELHDSRRKFTLTREEFRLINPNTLTCPIFRSERDAELTKKIYRATPVLLRDAVVEGEGKQTRVVQSEVNPWTIRLSTMFHMSNDSHLFLDGPSTDSLALYEAKLIHHFDHRWATYGPDGESRNVTAPEKQHPAFTITPRYWVNRREVWLRVARLPDGIMQALKEGNTDAIILGLTQLLFGRWLLQHSGAEIYPAWQAFVQEYPYSAGIAPTQLGLCGNNPACVQPLNNDYLPATEEVRHFMSNERTSTAWYAVDPHARERVLALAAEYCHLPEPTQLLNEKSDALTQAECWLEAACPKWLMGWRGIARATDERSVIGTIMPFSGVGNSCHLVSPSKTVSPRSVAAFIGNVSALVFDFVARQKIGGANFNYFIPKQLPVFPPDRYTEADLAFIAPRVLELTYTAKDLADWALDLGYDGPPYFFDPDRRSILRAELDAYYARLYGLSRDELRYILDPADVMGDDYPSESFRVLKEREEREFKEYRTRRLVLEAWDSLDRGEHA
jgi:hypothetical protein